MGAKIDFKSKSFLVLKEKKTKFADQK